MEIKNIIKKKYMYRTNKKKNIYNKKNMLKNKNIKKYVYRIIIIIIIKKKIYIYNYI